MSFYDGAGEPLGANICTDTVHVPMSPDVFTCRPVPLVTINFPLPFEYPLPSGGVTFPNIFRAALNRLGT
ncbi:MAG: hypothetical protein WBE77_10235 [Candidatus Cybelea sp.]